MMSTTLVDEKPEVPSPNSEVICYYGTSAMINSLGCFSWKSFESNYDGKSMYVGHSRPFRDESDDDLQSSIYLPQSHSGVKQTNQPNELGQHLVVYMIIYAYAPQKSRIVVWILSNITNYWIQHLGNIFQGRLGMVPNGSPCFRSGNNVKSR
jgi:hypothetical protein